MEDDEEDDEAPHSEEEDVPTSRYPIWSSSVYNDEEQDEEEEEEEDDEEESDDEDEPSSPAVGTPTSAEERQYKANMEELFPDLADNGSFEDMVRALAKKYGFSDGVGGDDTEAQAGGSPDGRGEVDIEKLRSEQKNALERERREAEERVKQLKARWGLDKGDDDLSADVHPKPQPKTAPPPLNTTAPNKQADSSEDDDDDDSGDSDHKATPLGNNSKADGTGSFSPGRPMLNSGQRRKATRAGVRR